MKKQLVALFMVTAMMLSMVACGNEENGKVDSESKGSTEVVSSGNEEKEEKKEIVELITYLETSNNGSVDYPWFDEFLAEEFGITLVNRANADGVLASMIASGELADITSFHTIQMMQEAIDAGTVLELSQYKDQLPNIFANDLFAKALDKEMNTYGAVYGLPVGVGSSSGFRSTVPDIRMDVFMSVGAPEVHSLDELLDLLKQMQEVYPETPEGEKVYALGLYSDMDGATIYPAQEMLFKTSGYSGTYITEYPYDLSGEPRSMISDGSSWYNVLKFFFKANQMGILDPDSPAMPYNEYNARALSGRYLMTPNDWHRAFNDSEENIAAGVGYAPYIAEFFGLGTAVDQVMGNSNNWHIAISAETENLDKVLEFVNWLYSYEAQELLQNGPEGIKWEYDTDGTRIMTEAYKDSKENGKVFNVEGKSFEEYMPALGALNQIITTSTVNSETGKPIGIDKQYPMYGTTKLDESWYSVYGQVDLAGLAKGEGKRKINIIESSPAIGMFSVLPQEVIDIYAAIKPVANNAYWSMVFAEDEAEFDAIWEQLKADAEELGAEKLHNETVKSIRAGIDTYAQYK